jgi:hypothetical protein
MEMDFLVGIAALCGILVVQIRLAILVSTLRIHSQYPGSAEMMLAWPHSE